jgi:enoyl-CoA hydratase/carnithine racemase
MDAASQTPGLDVRRQGSVARLRFTRPESRNSLSRELCAALGAALAAVAADSGCRAVVLEGSGGSFASGADLAEIGRLRAAPRELIDGYRRLRETQEQLYTMDCPTVAVIDGFCMGAGLSLALACDFRIAAAGSIFAAPPARLGLIYSDREIWRLMQRVGVLHSRELLFTGRRIDTARAREMGLVDSVGDSAALAPAVDALIADLLACSASSLRTMKRQLLRLETGGASAVGDDALAEAAFTGADAAEGIAAFLERRAPRFA